MTTLTLEPHELSLIIKALESLKVVHPCPVCDFTLTPVIAKLRGPQVPEEVAVPIHLPGPKRSKPWTEAEDAIIRKYSERGSPVWASMQIELPDRTLNMIKGRYGRLGLSPQPVAPAEPASWDPPTPIEHEVTTKEYVEATSPGSKDAPKPVEAAEPAIVTPGTEPKPPQATITNDGDWSWTTKGPPLNRLMGGR